MSGGPSDRPERSSDDLRVGADVGVERGPRIDLLVDGESVMAYEGETVAAALMASGIRVLRTTLGSGEARGVFCGMGTCYDCLMVIDGEPSQRACMVPARDGMAVRTQAGSSEAT
jgi:predicted molibdopterin-dependent oxidoreductase YjgC